MESTKILRSKRLAQVRGPRTRAQAIGPEWGAVIILEFDQEASGSESPICYDQDSFIRKQQRKAEVSWEP